MAEPQDDPEAVIPLVEEQLKVGKRQVEVGRVRVRIRTETETVNAAASLLDQHVEVERIPVGRDVTEVPPVRTEGDVTVIPVLEEVLVVEKRLVLIEEVHVRRRVSRTEVTQPVTLRRQRADVTRTGPETDNATKE